MYWPFDMAWYVWKEYSSRYSLWDEPWGWNVTDPATPFQVRMCDGSLDKHEKLYDAKGQYRDWLQLVLESAIVPDGTVDSDGLKCVKSACTDTDIYTKQQYYLQRVPSGDLFPILGTGRPNGTKTVANKYHFLGKWMAKAYVMQEDGFAPATFHRFIYDSIVAGEITKPQVADHYQENDAIEDRFASTLVVRRVLGTGRRRIGPAMNLLFSGSPQEHFAVVCQHHFEQTNFE